jgi:hypothetical protein
MPTLSIDSLFFSAVTTISVNSLDAPATSSAALAMVGPTANTEHKLIADNPTWARIEVQTTEDDCC